MAASTCSSLCYLCVRRIALFLLLVFLYASLFACRSSDGQLLERTEYLGGRRALLALDAGIEEDGLVKKKKKSSTSEGGEEVQTAKKKKVVTISEDSEADKPNEKKIAIGKDDGLVKKDASLHAGSEEVLLKKKKANTTEEEENDPLLEKKKKKKKVDGTDEETENQVLPKKKKKPTMEESDSEKPKKKNPTTEDQGWEEKPMKIKKNNNATSTTDQVAKLNKKKTTLLDVGEDEEQSSNKKKIKLAKPIRDLLKNQTNPPKSNQNLTSSAIKPNPTKNTQLHHPTTKPNSKLPDPDDNDDDDLISDFRNLPYKLQSAIIPDLHRISTTSKLYLNRANKQISQSFKPLVGSKYASVIASLSSYTFLLAPLLILPVLYTRIRTNFLPLQTVLIFVQVYLAVYFAVLSLAFLATGQEPLRFFYKTSAGSFVFTQLMQTMGYALYLLLLVVYLVVVFAGVAGGGGRAVGLVQAAVGVGVGAHYYVAVGHRAALRQAPRSNWKVHGVYAALFMGACLLARAERRKKAYLHGGGGEDGKTS